VAVIARVTDAEAWEALSEVRTPTLIGVTSDKTSIVTGRIPISRIEVVRSQKFVKSLKASQRMRPQLNKTTEETETLPNLLPPSHLANGGKGVVVGVIDYGADFAHDNFRLENGATRLLALWNQDASATAASPFGYGREHLSSAIDLALQKPNPYAELAYDPAAYEDPADPGAHGTHVLDIAAGNGRGTSVPGMAPNSTLIFVNISHKADPTGTSVVGKTFGDSVRLLEAAKYIFEKAGTQPCVINISLGTNGGPHDGTTLVEQGLDSLVSAKPNRAIVLAAGNAFDDGIHAKGLVKQSGTADLEWQVRTNPQLDIEMEVWYAAADRFTVELLDPDGTVQASCQPGQNKTLQIDHRVVFIANRLSDPNNGDNMIGIFLAAGIKPGTYTVRLHGDTVTNGAFHAWIERDNTFSSQFAPPHDPSLTIGTVSCGRACISVGSYDAHKAARPLSFFSSAGPTRDNREKPEVSAPGHQVRAAQSSTGSGSRLMSGTSMASPAVAGLIALMLDEARHRNIDLTIDQIRKILIDTARRKPPGGNAWHPQYGHGRVHAKAALKAVMDLAAAGGGPAPVAGAVTAAAAKPKPRRKRKAKGEV
jgi:subtilisin family serine protease